MSEVLFNIDAVTKKFAVGSGAGLKSLLGQQRYLTAVDGVNFELHRGEIVGLAGQSGCGKSTLGELLLKLQNVTSGTISFKDEDINEYDKQELKEFRRQCQIVFQDPYEALNPRLTVAHIVKEPLKIHGIGNTRSREEKVKETLNNVGLGPAEHYMDHLPKQLSGGEKQRVCIARALVLDPEFILADEPVSMLDVSVRASILRLFDRLRRERNLTILYISHDISTINMIADQMMVMYMGKIMEQGSTQQVIHSPSHPYTEALISSLPDPDTKVGEKVNLEGEVPNPIDIPSGCRFHPQCAYSTVRCLSETPDLRQRGKDEQEVACFHPLSE